MTSETAICEGIKGLFPDTEKNRLLIADIEDALSQMRELREAIFGLIDQLEVEEKHGNNRTGVLSRYAVR